MLAASTGDLRYLRFWHTRLNTLFFDGVLARPVLELKRVRKAYGLYYPEAIPRIVISHSLTRTEAKLTLAHEIIHQWQHSKGLPLTHGSTFREWALTLELYLGGPVF